MNRVGLKLALKRCGWALVIAVGCFYVAAAVWQFVIHLEFILYLVGSFLAFGLIVAGYQAFLSSNAWDRVLERQAQRRARRLLGAALNDACAPCPETRESRELADLVMKTAIENLRVGASDGSALWGASLVASRALAEAVPEAHARWMKIALDEGSDAERAARAALRRAAPNEYAIWNATLIARSRQGDPTAERPDPAC